MNQLINNLITTLALGTVSTKKQDMMWLNLDTHLTDAAATAAGKVKQDWLRKNRCPHAYIIVQPELLDVLNNRGIYPVKSYNADNFYYLKLIENRLYVYYQQIIGSWLLAELDGEQMGQLTERLTTLMRGWD